MDYFRWIMSMDYFIWIKKVIKKHIIGICFLMLFMIGIIMCGILESSYPLIGSVVFLFLWFTYLWYAIEVKGKDKHECNNTITTNQD